MFCPKCGNQVADGSSFCTACGAQLNAPAPAVEPISVPAQASAPEAPVSVQPVAVPEVPAPVQPVTAPEVPAPVQPVSASEVPVSVQPVSAPEVPVPVQPAPVPEIAVPVQTQEMPVPVQPVPMAPVAAAAPAGFVQPKKGIGNKKIIAIAAAAAAAVIIIIVAILGISSLFSSSSGDNAYAYLSNGKYGLITNLKKGQTVEIASSRSDATLSSLLAFSPDGKYVYYYTKYDPYTGTGSLCRAEYGKLKSDPSKNDKYIEVIATNASLGFRFLDDGTVTYTNSDDTLYYYNGKEAAQVAKGVNYYYLDSGSKRLVYVAGNPADGGSMLYGVDLKDIDNKVKLASNISYVSPTGTMDFDNILYVKYEDDGSQTLYMVGFNKESEKLARGVFDIVSTDDGKVYFTAENGTYISLYDYVDDAYADADSTISEPNINDFSVPRYSYDMVYGNNLSESDYDELYTSCTRDLYWYGESTWWSYSMEEALTRNWGDNTKGIVAATQSFINRFADSADEDGYILVTDEVKAALKEIQKNADDPTKEWQWLWLCYNKYESGTTTDYEAYEAAASKWYEAGDRIRVRETLQNKENDYPVRTLYCFEKGKLTPVNENVLSTMSYSDGIVFNTKDMITEKLSLENVYSAYDVENMFNIDNEAENYVLLSKNGETCRMSPKAAETIAETAEGNSGYVSLYFTDKEIFMNGGGDLYMASVSGGTVGDFTLISEDAQVQSIDSSTLYYTNGAYQNNNITYGDLYSCTGGNSTRLARDVILGGGGINIYDDGAILAYTGYREIYGYELSMTNSKGEATIIAENVTQYIRVDKSTLLYISDGDLYLYNGKEKTKVQDDVDWLWVQNSMDRKTVMGWMDYR